MKKILALVLALAMALALVACGSGSGSNGGNSAASNPPASSNPADSGEPSGDSSEPTGPSYPEMKLTVTLNNQEGETAGQLAKYFTEYITEKSGGAITFEVFYGGTLCSSAEALDFVGTAAVDMTLTGTAEHTATLPLINFPGFVYGSQEEALAYANFIAFENEATASLIAEELAALNITTLGMHAGGANAYFFKSEQPSLKAAAQSGLVIGTGMHLACYAQMGFGTAVSMPWDTYSELQTGVFDCTTMALGPAVGMSWTEVVPHILINNQYSFGNWWMINNDKWNAMDEATQALFLEAAQASQAKSLELYGSEIEMAEDAVAAANGSLNYMNEEETAWERDLFFAESYADCIANAANAGKSAEMKTVLEAVNEYLGLEIPVE